MSETVTRADLTNILNKVLPIRAETPCQTITLPFTPPANGLMIVRARNTANARAYQGFTNTTPSLVDNYQVSDGYWSQVVYVEKGKQVSLSTQSNVKDVIYYYIPLDDIASANMYANDYIIEQGTDGIWTYRKWNSGVAECWGTKSWSLSSWTQWGGTGIFYSTFSGQEDYPASLFISAPSVTANAVLSNGDAWYGTSNTESNTKSPNVFLLRVSTGSTGVQGRVHFHAKGNWK